MDYDISHGRFALTLDGWTHQYRIRNIPGRRDAITRGVRSGGLEHLRYEIGRFDLPIASPEVMGTYIRPTSIGARRPGLQANGPESRCSKEVRQWARLTLVQRLDYQSHVLRNRVTKSKLFCWFPTMGGIQVLNRKMHARNGLAGSTGAGAGGPLSPSDLWQAEGTPVNGWLKVTFDSQFYSHRRV